MSNAIAFSALIVSFVVGAFTLYWQFLKRVNVSVVLGEYAYIAYLKEKSGIEVTLAVALLNTGASDATVTRMTGHIESIDGSWKTSFSWLYYLETKTPPGLWWWSWEIQEPASAIVVPNRQAVTKWINFTSGDIGQTLPEGEYGLQVFLDGPRGKKYVSRPYHFFVSSDDHEHLETNCVPDQSGAVSTFALELLEMATSTAEGRQPPIAAPRSQRSFEGDSAGTTETNGAPLESSKGTDGATEG